VKAISIFLDCDLFYGAVSIIAQSEQNVVHNFSYCKLKKVSGLLYKARIKTPCFRDTRHYQTAEGSRWSKHICLFLTHKIGVEDDRLGKAFRSASSDVVSTCRQEVLQGPSVL